MPTTGPSSSANAGLELGSGGAALAGTVTSKTCKSGSMKIKRTTSAAKVLTKSKSSGSLKKKAEGRGGRSCSTSDEMEQLSQRLNGSLGDAEESEEQDYGEEKKDSSIKGLWKKAIKNMKIPGTEQKGSVFDFSVKAKKGGSLKRRDSRFDGEDSDSEEPKEIDPVYSLLKCAADLPKVSRANKEAQLSQGVPAIEVPRRSGDSARKSSSPSPQGLSLLAPPGCTCLNCGSTHLCDETKTHSLGHDFKQFYKQTSPIKRLSAAELGI